MGLIGAMDKNLKDKMTTYFFMVDTNGDGMLDQEVDMIVPAVGCLASEL